MITFLLLSNYFLDFSVIQSSSLLADSKNFIAFLSDEVRGVLNQFVFDISKILYLVNSKEFLFARLSLWMSFICTLSISNLFAEGNSSHPKLISGIQCIYSLQEGNYSGS